MGRCNPQPLPFWSLPTPESPISPNVLHTASTKAQAARTPNDERNEDRQSSTCQREGDWQGIEGGRGVEGSKRTWTHETTGSPDRSATGGTEVSEQALVPESNGITGRAQVSEKGPGAGDRGDREGEAYFGTRVLGIAARSGARALRSVGRFRRPSGRRNSKTSRSSCRRSAPR